MWCYSVSLLFNAVITSAAIDNMHMNQYCYILIKLDLKKKNKIKQKQVAGRTWPVDHSL